MERLTVEMLNLFEEGERLAAANPRCNGESAISKPQ